MEFDILTITFLVIILAVSIGFHEYAHALATHKLGDPTPKLQNRLTPNPLAHLDPIGFLAIFLIHFGRGKPVQINPYYYKNPLRDQMIVAIAGPITNLILATVGILILILYFKFNGIVSNGDIIVKFWILFAQINIALFVFNLIPLPPLDGFRILKYLKPNIGSYLEENMRIIFIIFLFVLFFGQGIIQNIIISISSIILNFIYFLLSSIFI